MIHDPAAEYTPAHHADMRADAALAARHAALYAAFQAAEDLYGLLDDAHGGIDFNTDEMTAFAQQMRDAVATLRLLINKPVPQVAP